MCQSRYSWSRVGAKEWLLHSLKCFPREEFEPDAEAFSRLMRCKLTVLVTGSGETSEPTCSSEGADLDKLTPLKTLVLLLFCWFLRLQRSFRIRHSGGRSCWKLNPVNQPKKRPSLGAWPRCDELLYGSEKTQTPSKYERSNSGAFYLHLWQPPSRLTRQGLSNSKKMFFGLLYSLDSRPRRIKMQFVILESSSCRLVPVLWVRCKSNVFF